MPKSELILAKLIELINQAGDLTARTTDESRGFITEYNLDPTRLNIYNDQKHIQVEYYGQVVYTFIDRESTGKIMEALHARKCVLVNARIDSFLTQ